MPSYGWQVVNFFSYCMAFLVDLYVLVQTDLETGNRNVVCIAFNHALSSTNISLPASYYSVSPSALHEMPIASKTL